jgi:hexokinase
LLHIVLIFFFLLFQIREACQDLILDDKTLREIMAKFLIEVERGLKKSTHNQADIKCFVTYVQDLPNGKGEKSKINPLTFILQNQIF